MTINLTKLKDRKCLKHNHNLDHICSYGRDFRLFETFNAEYFCRDCKKFVTEHEIDFVTPAFIERIKGKNDDMPF